MLEFLDTKTVFLIFHTFGLILGAGGAFTSDTIFFLAIKDKYLTKTEMKFLRLGSRLVWVGIIILLISGLLLVSLKPQYYLSSSKFLAKLTIVAIIVINGILFHRIHIPMLKEHIKTELTSSQKFLEKSPFLLISGVISFISWISTIALVVIKKISYSYLTIMVVYFVILIFSIFIALFLKNLFLKSATENKEK